MESQKKFPRTYSFEFFPPNTPEGQEKLRATTEQVNGVWQGACYPFREGLATGIMNVEFSPKGQLVASGFTTNRQWPVPSTEPFALQRARPGARRRGSPREDRLGEAAMLARRPRVPAKPSRAVRVRSVPLRGAVKVTKCRQ